MAGQSAAAVQGSTDSARPAQTAEGTIALDHKLFANATDLVFKKAIDGESAVCAFSMGGNTFAIELHKLVEALALPADGADHRMLRQIARSLKFVALLHLGDALPPEVLTGEASFTPSDIQIDRALRRIKGQLGCWLLGKEGAVTDPAELLRIADDPAMRERIQDAFAAAAEAIGLGRGESEEVIRRIEVIARDLATIEFLRENLISPLAVIARRVEVMRHAPGLDLGRIELIGRVSMLLKRALEEVHGRISEIDAATSEIVPVLRGLEQHRTLIRDGRDFLYARLVAWGDLLTESQRLTSLPVAQCVGLLNRLYRFLAQRYLPAVVWASIHKADTRAMEARSMTW